MKKENKNYYSKVYIPNIITWGKITMDICRRRQPF